MTPRDVHNGDALSAISFAWEQCSGHDSIDTIERIYPRTERGALRCVWPGCGFVRRDAEAMWRHVHTGHGNNGLPPDDFDPGPWL